MGIKVAKFGGTSVADATQIKKLKNIIQNDSDIKYVVVSAPGKRFPEDTKITDLLYMCKTHMEHNIPYEQIFQVISDRFNETCRELSVDVDIESELEEIKRNISNGVATVDYIASRGEYLNARIIAAHLGFAFVDAKEMIKFSDKGKFLEDITNDSIKRVLSRHDRVVIPGFYGEKLDGSIRTFSRGGSDITGALIARAAGAQVYQNWTDVSGFLMADPRIVDNPKAIETISYMELRELAYMGASVLHEDAIYPAKAANIPINIRNTNRPEDPGTMITAEPSESSEQIVSGIAGKKGFTIIGVYKSHLANEKGFIRKLAGIMEDNDMTIEHLPTGIDTMSVVLDDKMLNGKLDEIVDEFRNQLKPDTLDVFEDIALIATVGVGMAARKGTAARLFEALAEAGVNIRMIDQGSTEMNIIVGVESKDFQKAIRAIYDAFVQ